ncbi:MAG: hypothetical protein ACTSVM_05215 [Candidatus Ranarchaeia archaeon]
MPKIECTFCGYEFVKHLAEAICRGCSGFWGSCGYIRCPNCGTEMPRNHLSS